MIAMKKNLSVESIFDYLSTKYEYVYALMCDREPEDIPFIVIRRGKTGADETNYWKNGRFLSKLWFSDTSNSFGFYRKESFFKILKERTEPLADAQFYQQGAFKGYSIVRLKDGRFRLFNFETGKYGLGGKTFSEMTWITGEANDIKGVIVHLNKSNEYILCKNGSRLLTDSKFNYYTSPESEPRMKEWQPGHLINSYGYDRIILKAIIETDNGSFYNLVDMETGEYLVPKFCKNVQNVGGLIVASNKSISTQEVFLLNPNGEMLLKYNGVWSDHPQAEFLLKADLYEDYNGKIPSSSVYDIWDFQGNVLASDIKGNERVGFILSVLSDEKCVKYGDVIIIDKAGIQ